MICHQDVLDCGHPDTISSEHSDIEEYDVMTKERILNVKMSNSQDLMGVLIGEEHSMGKFEITGVTIYKLREGEDIKFEGRIVFEELYRRKFPLELRSISACFEFDNINDG